MSEGSAKLIDVFVGERGMYVVLDNAVTLTDRSGVELARQSMAREVTAAAFDGSTLVVADKGKFTSFDADLKTIMTADLLESCASAVMVSQKRFVCGPSNDWDRVFYVYDAETGKLVKSSKEYTYNGIPMRRVPGTDDFITTSVDSSPSDFHLYSLDQTGEPVFVNESPYHGDFGVTNTYAFNAVPATHLITHQGIMLRIYGDGCTSGASSFGTGCLVKDGALGTLSGSQIFLGMDNDSSGKLYGLVDPSPGSGFSESRCKNGCLIQRIDVASKIVEAQSMVHLEIGALIALRHDPQSKSITMGYRLGSPNSWSSDPYPGHAIAQVVLE